MRRGVALWAARMTFMSSQVMTAPRRLELLNGEMERRRRPAPPVSRAGYSAKEMKIGSSFH